MASTTISSVAYIWVSSSITPVSVTAGTSYVVAMSGGAFFINNSNVVTPVTTGDITINEERISLSNNTFPTTAYNTFTYGQADVSFVPTGIAGSVLVATAGGNVGIGTSTPSQKLQIGSASAGGNVLVANGWLCVGNGNSGTTLGACGSASTTAAGTIYAKSLSIVQGDYAERYPSTENGIEPGTLVAADGQNSGYIVRASSTSGVMGVVSTAPGIVIGDNSPTASSTYAVALSGRVPVKVTNENGDIHVGDYITLSKELSGYGMKATYSGEVIGHALENFEPGATSTGGSILVFLGIGFQNINNTFVLGDNDGQLTSATSSLVTQDNFLINQQGTGSLLQLQSGGQNRLLIANNGSFNLFASTTISTSTILSVFNGTTTEFSITAAGHITVGQDTAGTATIKAGNNQTTVTFNVPYDSVPKIAVTVQGLPNFFYGVATKTPDGFVIQTSQPVTADTSFDWIALAQPSTSTSVSSLNAQIVVVSRPAGQGQISSVGSIASGTSTPTGSVGATPPDASSTPPASGTVAGTSTTASVTPPPATTSTPPAVVTPPAAPPAAATPPADITPAAAPAVLTPLPAQNQPTADPAPAPAVNTAGS